MFHNVLHFVDNKFDTEFSIKSSRQNFPTFIDHFVRIIVMRNCQILSSKISYYALNISITFIISVHEFDSG